MVTIVVMNWKAKIKVIIEKNRERSLKECTEALNKISKTSSSSSDNHARYYEKPNSNISNQWFQFVTSSQEKVPFFEK